MSYHLCVLYPTAGPRDSGSSTPACCCTSSSTERWVAVVTFPVPRQGWTGGSQPLEFVVYQYMVSLLTALPCGDTVDWEIFAVKIFCQLLRRQKLNPQEFFCVEWLEHVHAPCGENWTCEHFLCKKKNLCKKFSNLRYLQVMFYPLEAVLPKSIDALYFEPSFLSV